MSNKIGLGFIIFILVSYYCKLVLFYASDQNIFRPRSKHIYGYNMMLYAYQAYYRCLIFLMLQSISVTNPLPLSIPNSLNPWIHSWVRFQNPQERHLLVFLALSFRQVHIYLIGMIFIFMLTYQIKAVPAKNLIKKGSL